MSRNKAFAFTFLVATVMAGTCLSPDAYATWSVATVNPHTETLGVAAASCSGGVYGIQAIVPGKGVVIVQAASNNDARQAAVALLRKNVPLQTIMAKIADPVSGYQPERQQYTLLPSDTRTRPQTYTGAEVPGAKGSVVGDRFSVQANTMVSDEVVARTAAVLRAADWPDDLSMARAMMRAMEAGAAAGGDRRCGKTNSNTAFIGLYRKSDLPDQPWVELAINGVAPDKESGMAHLHTLFEQWRVSGAHSASTRRFVVPGAKAPGRPHPAPPSSRTSEPEPGYFSGWVPAFARMTAWVDWTVDYFRGCFTHGACRSPDQD